MSLSSEIVSQFAKITNDQEKPNTGSTVYGRYVEYNGQPHIQMDGSDLLTPVTGTTTNFADGDRVTGIIKDHSLTVTGNITQPGITKADDIEDGTIEPVKLVDGSLEVGVNVKMGPNTVLTWDNLPSDVASDDDILSEERVTTITKDAISTATIRCDQLEAGTWGGDVFSAFLTVDGDIAKIGNANGYVECGSTGIVDINTKGNVTITSRAGYVEINGGSERALDVNGKLEATNVVTNGAVYPLSSGSYGCGLSGNRWSNVYTNGLNASGDATVSGTLNGSAGKFTNVYVSSSTTTSNAYCGFSSTGCLLKYSGSSEKFKRDISDLDDTLKDKFRGLYDVDVKEWYYKDGYLSEDDQLNGVKTYGLIAEDVEKVLPEAVVYEDGNISNYRDRHILNALLFLVQEQKKKIDNLEDRMSRLEGIVLAQNGD